MLRTNYTVKTEGKTMKSNVTLSDLSPAEKLFIEKSLQVFRQTTLSADRATDWNVLGTIGYGQVE